MAATLPPPGTADGDANDDNDGAVAAQARAGHRRALALIHEGADAKGAAVAGLAALLPPDTALTDDVRRGLERANALVIGALADGTTRKYRRDWALFAAWCRAQSLVPLPCSVATLAAFLGLHAGPHAALAPPRGGAAARVAKDTGLSPQRLEGYRAAIRWVHDLAGAPNPGGDRLIARLMLGVKRAWQRPKRKAAALTTYGGAPDEPGPLLRVVAAIDTGDLRGLRDRALVLVAFFGALRRSELCALTLGALDRSRPEGLLLRIRNSKGDKANEGQTVGLTRRPGSPLCPIAALDAWIRAASLAGADAPLFRKIDRWGHLAEEPLHPAAIAWLFKRLAAAAGLDEEQVALISGHSTRAGYANSALADGGTLPQVMQKLRHKHPRTLMEYMRERDALEDPVKNR